MSFKKKLLSGLVASSLCFSVNVFALDYDINVNALHYAVSINKIGYVEELIESEPNLVTQYNKDGLTPIHVAIDSNSLSSLKMLLKNKVNPNIKNALGETPLTYAIKAGKVKSASILLDYKANPEIMDLDGKTSKDYAKDLGKYDILFKDVVSKSSPVPSLNTDDLKQSVLLELEKKIAKNDKENKELIKKHHNDIIEKITFLEENLSILESELLKVSEQSMETTKSLELTDINLIEVDDKLSNVLETSSVYKKDVNYLLKSVDILKGSVKELKERELLNMYSGQDSKEETEIKLIGYSEESSINTEEDEIEIISFGENIEVELEPQDDNSLDY